MDTKKSKLDHLKGRLKNAYELPVSEQEHWHKQISEIEAEVSKLERDLGVYQENEAIKLLFEVNRRIADKWAGGEGSLDRFLNKNPGFKQQEDKAGKMVDDAFKTGGVTTLKRALRFYESTLTQIVGLINSETVQNAEQEGFKLLQPDSKEAKKADKVFKVKSA